MILVLKRHMLMDVSDQSGFIVKDQNPLQFPRDLKITLNCGKFKQQYKIVCVVCHIGNTPSSGHYLSIHFHGNNSVTICNDKDVTISNYEEVHHLLQTSSYLVGLTRLELTGIDYNNVMKDNNITVTTDTTSSYFDKANNKNKTDKNIELVTERKDESKPMNLKSESTVGQSTTPLFFSTDSSASMRGMSDYDHRDSCSETSFVFDGGDLPRLSLKK